MENFKNVQIGAVVENLNGPVGIVIAKGKYTKLENKGYNSGIIYNPQLPVTAKEEEFTPFIFVKKCWVAVLLYQPNSNVLTSNSTILHYGTDYSFSVYCNK